MRRKNPTHEDAGQKNKAPFHGISEKYLHALLKRADHPVAFNRLCDRFGLQKHQRKELREILARLVRDGSVAKLRGKRFTGIPEQRSITGTLWCTRSGNGFVVPQSEGSTDIFVASRHMRNALHGDVVTVKLDPYSGKRHREGWIVDIVSRNAKRISGHLQTDRDALYLVPEDSRYGARLSVVDSRFKAVEKPRSGDFVIARIIESSDTSAPQCQIEKVFRKGLNSVEVITNFITKKFDLSVNFRKSVRADSGTFSPAFTNEERRKDLRHFKHVTVDGELARDFDDAVCVRKDHEGYILLVSIADVSEYVKPGSPVDKEAYRRGTSIYFPGKVLPMLPEQLSNSLCSIIPFEDRLAVTVEMRFNQDGALTNEAFYTSIIKSSGRFTYREVDDLISGQYSPSELQNDVSRTFIDMVELSTLLRKRRHERGSLDFDLPEPQVLLDIEGGIQNISKTERLISHQIVEEFMISANEAVARFLNNRHIPALYRIHEGPDIEDLTDIQKLFAVLKGRHQKRKYGARYLMQSLLQEVRGTSHEFLTNRVILRAMKQARYSSTNKGHYGLASNCYLHFTSPIRRYPDLICHRSLKAALYGGKPDGSDLEKIANHLSTLERKAMEAEREFVDRTRILFMKDKLGRTYDGIISHVTSYGFYVELVEIFVEGLVLLSSLSDDFYSCEEAKFRIFGRRTHKSYRIGDGIRIRVVRADVESKELLFTPS